MSNGITTTFTLDIQGLPEVIQTGAGETYLHLPGVIVTESAAGEIRYLLGDGLGSVRQAVDELGAVVAYNEYDPYGNPYFLLPAPYAFTGEWWQDNLDLLYLRARWYAPTTGTFLSVDPVESEPPYQYVGGNVVNRVDPSGLTGYSNDCEPCKFKASGYSEGYSAYTNFAFFLPFTGGYETVYDFATMERDSFYFSTNWLLNGLKIYAGFPDGRWDFDWQIGTGVDELGITGTYTNLDNFTSWEDIVKNYEGIFHGFMVGLNTPLIQVGSGYVNVWGEGENAVTGDGYYVLLGAGIDLPWLPFSATYFKTQYLEIGDHEWYTDTGTESGRVGKSEVQKMGQDIYYGNHLPIPFNWTGFKYIADSLGQNSNRVYALNDLQQTWERYQAYFTTYFRNCNSNRVSVTSKQ